MEYSSILDHPAISGCYLFPQARSVRDPFVVALDGCQLACYRRTIDPRARTVVHFHGNGESVADYVPDLADIFQELGLNSLFVEYRGYGASTGRAQLAAMRGDGEAVIAAAGIAPQDAILFGRSIGSLYAIELASRCPDIAGLILESGIADPAERFLAYAEFSGPGLDEESVLAEVKRNFDHQRKLAGYSGPLLVMHTEDDGLIDISHAERNYKWAAGSHKQLLRFPDGNHNSIMAVNLQEYFQAVDRFAKSIAPKA
jgi:pimeloyl-ACP methyl ester carboxylesterase